MIRIEVLCLVVGSLGAQSRLIEEREMNWIPVFNAKVSVGDHCIVGASQCSNFDENSVCHNSICWCKNGLPVIVNNTTIHCQVKYGEKCLVNGMCSDRHTVCEENKCVCKLGYKFTNDTTQIWLPYKPCITAKVGEDCTAFDKLPPSSNCSNGLVECVPNKRANNHNTSCVQGT
ncbi:hypothetical protein GQR58_002927 [Nymphon striatum]|nr:hypothetical protein GQR58_002927 [Nymphon striatum]